MGTVVCDITVSADGYTAGLNQTEERPFGDDGGDGTGDRLHAWMFDTPEESRAEVDRFLSAGAFIMGRNMFGPIRGPWDRAWNGWWGKNPPFRAPVFVLTHHEREQSPPEFDQPVVPAWKSALNRVAARPATAAQVTNAATRPWRREGASDLTGESFLGGRRAWVGSVLGRHAARLVGGRTGGAPTRRPGDRCRA
jgi:dihydrofolate reductase